MVRLALLFLIVSWITAVVIKEHILHLKLTEIKLPPLVFQIVNAERSNHRFIKTTTKKATTKRGTTKKVTTKKGSPKGTTKKSTTKSTSTTWPRPFEHSVDWSGSIDRFLPIIEPSSPNNTDYASGDTNSYTDYTDNNWEFQYVNDGIDIQGADSYFSSTTQRNAVIQKRRNYRYYYDYVPPRQTRYFNAFSFNRRFRSKWYWRG